TVQTRHQQGSEAQVGVADRVREVGFDTTGLGRSNPRNPDGSRTVAGRVRQHDGCFKAGNQTLVRVGAGVGEGVDDTGVLDDTADVVQRFLGQARVHVASKDVGAIFGNGLVHVHAGT